MTRKQPKTPEQQIAELKAKMLKDQQRLNQKKARIKNIEARQKAQARKDDTRRCIIAGRYALKHCETNRDSEFYKKLERLLNEYVTKDTDRKLFEEIFNLPPIPTQKK